jgi:hypothetical protein
VLTVGESGAAPTEAAAAFAAPVGHKGPRVEDVGGEREGTFLAATWEPALAPLPPQTTYPPVPPRFGPGAPQPAPLVVNTTASPTTEGPVPVSSGEPREQVSDGASPTVPATKQAPADREPAQREPAEAAPAVTVPASRDYATAPSRQSPDAPPGVVPARTEPTTALLESTEHGSTTPQLPPTETTQPPPALSSQAQCRDGGFVAFGFENQDECTSFVAARSNKEPSNKNRVK